MKLHHTILFALLMSCNFTATHQNQACTKHIKFDMPDYKLLKDGRLRIGFNIPDKFMEGLLVYGFVSFDTKRTQGRGSFKLEFKDIKIKKGTNVLTFDIARESSSDLNIDSSSFYRHYDSILPRNVSVKNALNYGVAQELREGKDRLNYVSIWIRPQNFIAYDLDTNERYQVTNSIWANGFQQLKPEDSLIISRCPEIKLKAVIPKFH